MRPLALAGILVLFWTASAAAWHTEKHELLQDAVQVVEEMHSSPDEGIPSALIQKAKALIVIPTLLKGGFMLGARYGEGVATVRDPHTGQWSPPAFITTAGASFGFQAGAQAIDLVLLVMTERGIKGLLRDQFTLGGDIALTAGPVGRYAEAGTDLLLQGEMYSYSRSKGIFGGVSLKGTVIQSNEEKNRSYYGKAYDPAQIMLSGKLTQVPHSAEMFMKAMNRLAPAPPNPFAGRRLAQNKTDTGGVPPRAKSSPQAAPPAGNKPKTPLW